LPGYLAMGRARKPFKLVSISGVESGKKVFVSLDGVEISGQ